MVLCFKIRLKSQPLKSALTSRTREDKIHIHKWACNILGENKQG